MHFSGITIGIRFCGTPLPLIFITYIPICFVLLINYLNMLFHQNISYKQLFMSENQLCVWVHLSYQLGMQWQARPAPWANTVCLLRINTLRLTHASGNTSGDPVALSVFNSTGVFCQAGLLFFYLSWTPGERRGKAGPDHACPFHKGAVVSQEGVMRTSAQFPFIRPGVV